MDPYNGYTSKERERKLRASYKEFPNRSHPLYRHPECQLCGDIHCRVEPHTEDYSVPYLWDNPAEYAVCKTCHNRIHRRFKAPAAWEAYRQHVRRGGYGSDLKVAGNAREIATLAKALTASIKAEALRILRPRNLSGTEWWEQLSTDPRTLTDPAARPRL